MLRITAEATRVRVAVRVQPRASRNAVVGEHDGALKVALTAPPVDGEANAALLAFLADALGVPKRAVRLVSGDTGRSKVVEVEGVTPAAVEALVAGGAGR